jgi:hypothetical protein
MERPIRYTTLSGRPVDADENPPLQTGEIETRTIRCPRWLGGLLNQYCRQAA